MGATPAPGDVAPDFTLADSTGTVCRLAELVAARPRVLLFYRGHW